MRILFLSKRAPQQRDLITRPYGRFYHLPVGLAQLGHDVRVQLCSHRELESTEVTFGNVRWSGNDVRTLGLRGLMRRLANEVESFRPDWIIGCSDSWFGWLAQRLASKTEARVAVDAYDNYEAYMPWNVPMHLIWRRAIRSADLVTAAGPQLATLLQSHRVGGHDVEVLPMAADPEFVPLDRDKCRQQLGLPRDAFLLGYVGSWARNRGTDMLLSAFRQARLAQSDLKLVLSGRPPAYALDEPGVIGSGYIPDEQLPSLINALDVACVITANTSFGQYSYPAKLCEAMACNVPVVATATEPVRWMLGERDDHLVPTGNTDEFVKRIFAMRSVPRSDYGVRPTWKMQAQRLDQLLSSVSRRKL